MAVAAPGDLDLDLRPGDLDVAFRNGDRDGFLGTGGMGGRKVGFRSFLGGGWLGSASSSEESRGLSPPESSPAMSIAIATDALRSSNRFISLESSVFDILRAIERRVAALLSESFSWRASIFLVRVRRSLGDALEGEMPESPMYFSE